MSQSVAPPSSQGADGAPGEEEGEEAEAAGRQPPLSVASLRCGFLSGWE